MPLPDEPTVRVPCREPDRTDPNGHYPRTRNQTLYATTRDFVTFTPPQVMSNRPGHGTLDAVTPRRRWW
ncbi:hypothetical protein [Micromonospora sp. WMMD710]|uniref:hypothetical protein n=1 Tax=Micromonospora sp. WMMD710 TaxID=3016085 RepID=UPI0024170106|nr:hypothetical protein [Micromonospora sp. WMMD710]MDG4757359.1 hypothetical protein [Micromonospora sp. WMMD710]